MIPVATPLTTTHLLHCTDAQDLSILADESIDLVVTSPPYPMIKMWDQLFSNLCPTTARHLCCENGPAAFEAMHRVLDNVWSECFRVLKPGSFFCINIGDATRTINHSFQLYSNHARCISSCTEIGFTALPIILWKKPTNAPNKFMGSGMLPAGAYVTLEHEYILVFRKFAKRPFISAEQKLARMRSACFWEERNRWFSDVWDIAGVKQGTRHSSQRDRSAAFPFELPWRLICMYSLYDDVVLDPFAGIGTTQLAALTAGRNSIGIDCDQTLCAGFSDRASSFLPTAQATLRSRLASHRAFTAQRREAGTPCRYRNTHLAMEVMTRQETELSLTIPDTITVQNAGGLSVNYISCQPPSSTSNKE